MLIQLAGFANFNAFIAVPQLRVQKKSATAKKLRLENFRMGPGEGWPWSVVFFEADRPPPSPAVGCATENSEWSVVAVVRAGVDVVGG